MHKVFITGSSIICALGNNKKESINKLKNINNKNYKEYLKENFEDINYYKIKQNFKTQKEKFFSILEKTILDAINDAKLSKEDRENLHIYLSSTSMNISLIEESFSTTNSIHAINFEEISNFVENIISSKYPCVFIQTACTSSANAIIKASNEIKNEDIQKAIIIGFEFFNQSTYKGFESLMLLSSSGEYKPFDKDSDGLILGEACSCVILENSKKTDDDFEIVSYSNSFDNYSITSSNPDAIATFNCLNQALKNANLEISDLTCLKAHATGSENSNLSEVNAINNLFKHHKNSCDVVVLKPYIGHTLGSCGTNEIILLCESIKSGTLPKTINFKNGYENIDFKPLLEDKVVNGANILFHFVGFGGSNASLVLSNKRS